MTITLTIGQVVPWGPAPTGFAQICDLRRRKVGLCYPFKNSRVARPIVRAVDLHQLMTAHPVMFPTWQNPYNRACPKKNKGV